MLVPVRHEQIGGMVAHRERITLARGWAEWDRDSFVRVGDRAMPGRVDVTMPPSPDGWPALNLTIEVRRGVPEYTRVEIVASPAGREVRVTDLRAVRLEDWIEQVVALTLVDVTESEEGRLVFQRSIASSLRLDGATEFVTTSLSDVADFLRGDEEIRDSEMAVRKVRAASRRVVNDDLLQLVANTYRVHANDRPTEHVKSEFRVSYRTAGRYVQLARERGFLPETTSGKVGL